MIQTAREKREQLIFLGVMAVLGLLAVVGGIGYGLELDERVGPGLMPFAAGVLMLLTVAVQLLRRLRTPVSEPEPEVGTEAELEPAAELAAGSGAEPATATGESEDADVVADAATPDGRRVATIFAMIVLAVAATYLIGMLLSVSLLVGALFLLNDRTKPVTALIAAVAAGLFGWLVFETLLDVPLPTGLLGLI